MQPSKMHFVTLPSTGYRKSTVFYESDDRKKKKKIRFLAYIPLSRSREHMPESSSISLMYFSASLASLTELDHDADNNVITYR